MDSPAHAFFLWYIVVLPRMLAIAIACAAITVAPIVLGVWIAGEEIVWRSVIGGVITFGGAIGSVAAFVVAVTEP